jgi:hypothetical protein
MLMFWHGFCGYVGKDKRNINLIKTKNNYE